MNNIKITSYKNNIELLKILSHPDRMQIVVALMQHTILNVTEFVNMLQIPQAAVSQHLSRMKGNILCSEKKGSEVYYYLSNSKAPKVIEVLLSNNK